jgi:hypothetical protein
MIDFLEKYLFQVQIILTIICWTYMAKYVINQLKEKNEKNKH